MPDANKPHYDLEPGDDANDDLRAELESAPPPTSAAAGPSTKTPAGDVHELDVCPNCGASMRGADELVCMRCGFDLKTMRVLETRKGEVEIDEEAERDAALPPLSPNGRGDLWLPGVVAGVSILVLVIAYAGGVSTLFPGAETPAFGERFVAIVQLLVRLAVWSGCGLGALWATARLVNQQPLGDLRIAAVRVLAAVAAINLVRFIGLERDSWEQGLELVLQAGLFPFALVALFGIGLRDAAVTAVTAIAALLAMVLAPLIVSWSI